MPNEKLLDLVAQLVEHLPFKERVLGSSPSQITLKSLRFSEAFFMFKSVDFIALVFIFTHLLKRGLMVHEVRKHFSFSFTVYNI